MRCECYQCYSGDRCETKNEDCVVVIHGGDPLIFEDYWVAQPQVTVSMDAAYRLAAEGSASGGECLMRSNNNAASCVAETATRAGRDCTEGRREVRCQAKKRAVEQED